MPTVYTTPPPPEPSQWPTPLGKPQFSESQMLAALARAAELEREIDELRRERMAWLVENGPGGWIDNLRRERDALRADAVRYRWLREQDWFDALMSAVIDGGPIWDSISGLRHPAGLSTPGVRTEPGGSS